MKNYHSNTSRYMLFPRILLPLLTLFLFSTTIYAGNANLAWDASTSTNVGGYKLSYGQNSGSYTSTIDVGNTTTYSLPNLQEGTKYYFAVKAYDSARTIESAYSNESSTTIPVVTLPPVTIPTPIVNPNPGTGTSNSGLVAAYGFEETNGAAVVTDASGNGNNGTIQEAVRIATGRYGNALKFDGVNDLVTINNSASLGLSTSMTLEAWVYPQSLTSGGKTILLKEGSGNEFYSLYANEDTNLPISYINNGSYHAVSGTNQLPINQWTHLVATYDGQYQRLYINGVQVDMVNQTGLIQQSSGALRIGGNTIWGEYFQGYIDEVRIYNRALSATEINYNLATPVSASITIPTPTVKPTVAPTPTVKPTVAPTPTVKPTPVTSTSNEGLVAAYGFEELSGAIVADASGNGNHGTIKEAVRIAKGRYGKALKFDGVNDWVTINDSASLGLKTSMTLEAWVYPQSLNIGGKTVILKEQPEGAAYNLYSSEDASLPTSSFNDDSYHAIAAPNALPMNKWTHLVATYDGEYQRLYVNGLEVAKNAEKGLIEQSTGELHIGGNSIWGEYFKGYIDEVRIYNRALTETEVQNNLKTAISVSNPMQFVIGNNTLEPGIDYSLQGTAKAIQTVPKKSGVVTAVQVYLDTSSTATTLVAGLYKDDNGHPGALIAQGNLNKLKRGVWNSVQIPAVSVATNEPYWIAILGAKGKIGFRDRSGSDDELMETSLSHTLTKLPISWPGAVNMDNSTMSVVGKGY